MKSVRILFTLLFVVSASAVFATAARADEFHSAIVTFSQPVEIPGKVLPEGRYIFELVEPGTHVVRITSADGMHVYATLFTVPDYRTETPEKNIVTLQDRKDGSPDAVHTWFFPGDNTGEEFLYTRP